MFVFLEKGVTSCFPGHVGRFACRKRTSGVRTESPPFRVLYGCIAPCPYPARRKRWHIRCRPSGTVWWSGHTLSTSGGRSSMPTLCCLYSTSVFSILMSSQGRSPRCVSTDWIFSTTSSPSVTSPNTVYCPSRCGVPPMVVYASICSSLSPTGLPCRCPALPSSDAPACPADLHGHGCGASPLSPPCGMSRGR